MIDFTPLLNEARLKKEREAPKRTYLGASLWGDECTRKLAYHWHGEPTDEADPFPGEILRVFDMGHDCEERMADYLRAAGFTLLTEDASTGKQFQFSTLDGALAGNCDGIILDGPLGLPYPLVWENKGVSETLWNLIRKHGLKEGKFLYYGQVQSYAAYIESELFEGLNGGLFTMLNRATGEVHAEFVPFDVKVAQWISDRALDVIQSKSPDEFQKLHHDPGFFKCHLCNWRMRCHGLMKMPEMSVYDRDLFDNTPSGLPAWMIRAAEDSESIRQGEIKKHLS